jgi:glycosyltransferase involved in cell wall biosynthesis
MLLEAFAVLKQQAGFDDVSLVLVGGKGWFYDEIYARVENLGLASQVCFTGYVPDNDLTYWYNLAAVLVFPSVYEGFGLPVLEAMACGVPVVAANTSSVPEVLGQAGLLFEPSDITALVDHLIGVLQDRDKMDRLIAAGREQARQFRWERSGQQMQEVYQRALQNH